MLLPTELNVDGNQETINKFGNGSKVCNFLQTKLLHQGHLIVKEFSLPCDKGLDQEV